ncbi:potassium-transporting ATPase subunit KdpC [Proteus sp. G2669]|uniref:potassium-transporting ATPase subunit KdpC n=1 Tax=unclassified Proteus (in: enterobacteria) TaxID=257482 RepID=UPI001411D7B8|nr:MULTISPECIES: potassium-transporting ATPase subunit KdpC [unclassified Proteus (in: enterobacteria)]NBM56602.1 potassium-transporting ATPase subunit KdpC [Proteus sp. G2669]UDN38014.1 potassium-transporting ATPase subunit KdpC [Proteus sp. NMG38-2]
MPLFRSSLVMLLLLTLITGLAYPLLVTGLANLIFPWQAKGSLIYQDDTLIGSELIGQQFNRTDYFKSRPSMTTERPYNSMASGASQLAVSNPLLLNEVVKRVQIWQKNVGNHHIVPVDLVTASGSGLDPHISLQAAYYQVENIAQLRQLSKNELEQLIKNNTISPLMSFMGEPVVNVFMLNQALDKLSAEKQQKASIQ